MVVDIPVFSGLVETVAVLLPVLLLIVLILWYAHAVYILYLHSSILYLEVESVSVDMGSISMEEYPRLDSLRSSAAETVFRWLSDAMQKAYQQGGARPDAPDPTRASGAAQAGVREHRSGVVGGEAGVAHGSPEGQAAAAAAPEARPRDPADRATAAGTESSSALANAASADQHWGASFGIKDDQELSHLAASAGVTLHGMVADVRRVVGGKQHFLFKARLMVRVRNESEAPLSLGKWVVELFQHYRGKPAARLVRMDVGAVDVPGKSDIAKITSGRDSDGFVEVAVPINVDMKLPGFDTVRAVAG